MNTSFTLSLLTILAAGGFFLGQGKARTWVIGKAPLHSRPPYHGFYLASWIFIPGLLVLLLGIAAGSWWVDRLLLESFDPTGLMVLAREQAIWLNKVKLMAAGVVALEGQDIQAVVVQHFLDLNHRFQQWTAVLTLLAAIMGFKLSWRRLAPRFPARNRVERLIRITLLAASSISFFITLGIVFSLAFEALRFFHVIPIQDFLFGLEWSPQTAIRPDQVGGTGSFGAVPLFAGTMMITAIAMAIAVPVGLFAAIYLSEFATAPIRGFLKPALEILAGIPTVVYGFFAALVVAPFVAGMGKSIGLEVASESALAAGLVMGVMIIPFISSLSDDVINAVPQSLRDASLAIGATEAETIRQVVLPAALPGLVGAFLLAVSRAVGETMIVVMAAGLSANLTANPLSAMTTVTVQIVTLLVGDQEFDSPKTLAAFALGLSLFTVTLVLNVIALSVVNKYHEKQ